jgi:hypothetical protein
MKPIVCALLLLVSTVLRSRVSLQLEIVALRHQLAVYQRTTKRPQINSGDRILWSWLARRWSGWRDALVFVLWVANSYSCSNRSLKKSVAM